jgi:type III secretory pathway component EscU
MGTFMYSVFTALGVCLIGGGLALQILYIENYQNDFQNYVPHQFASIILNTLVVCYLLFSLMYYRSYSSDMSMAVAVLALLIGLAMEIYSTQFDESPTLQGLSYTFAVLNALIRLYILITVRCGSATSSIPDLIKQLSKEVKNSGQSADNVAKAVKADLGAQSSDIPDPTQTWNRIQSMVGADFKKIPDAELAKSIKDQIQKALGLPPKEPKGGRR